MSGAATLPWSAGTWNDCVKSSKSALRWDIKNSLKSLCKRLTEVGEECFIVTVNASNGWVGHIGTLKGDEYIEDRSQIIWDFLQYCRENDCIDSSTNESTDESEEENDAADNQTDHNTGNKEEESDSTETDEWEPDQWVPEPGQSDRSLRSHDHVKGPQTGHTVDTAQSRTIETGVTHQKLSAGESKSLPEKPKTHKRSQLTRQSSWNKSPLKRQILYMRSKRHIKDADKLKLGLKCFTKRSKTKKINLIHCDQCPRVFKHENLYHNHFTLHKRRKPQRTKTI